MTSNHHALYDLGYTRTTMAFNKEKQDREVEQNENSSGISISQSMKSIGLPYIYDSSKIPDTVWKISADNTAMTALDFHYLQFARIGNFFA